MDDRTICSRKVIENVDILKRKCDENSYAKLLKIKNLYLWEFLARFVELLNPESIFVSNNSPEDIQYIRDKALETGEEIKLKIEGHTAHFDGYKDQARDKENTKLLLPPGVSLGSNINTADRQEGLKEILETMKDIMQGKILYILFFCLGLNNSVFSIPAVQLTDSSYVAHSENILFRPGYEEFVKLDEVSNRFFKFVHSQGELDGTVSKNVDKRRIYIDLEEDVVYSANTQYGGNSIGLKKLAMRLGIKRAYHEGWLVEHMFLMGVHGPNGRVTYFAGAFPSMCGKTSTAMIPGESIIGDDIVYIREINGKAHAVNVEKGIFGIIQDVNPEDDPVIWNVLNKPGEIIFSNVLITDEGGVYWIGKPGKVPGSGINHSGIWKPGKRDESGKEIPPSHKNARFTVGLENLDNLDPGFYNPEGVELGGIIYGGRDSDTWVPVQEAFDWVHGIITMGASIESETTAATLGKTGVRKFNPMSNLDFLSIPIGDYVRMNLEFGQSLKRPPKIFSVNYFLKDESGSYLNSKLDKRVWLKWMELRVHNDVEATDIGISLIPKYNDLKLLFSQILGKEYKEEEYIKQFTLRIPENISKIHRIKGIYCEMGESVPEILFKVLEEQRKKLEHLREKYGDYISPYKFQ